MSRQEIEEALGHVIVDIWLRHGVGENVDTRKLAEEIVAAVAEALVLMEHSRHEMDQEP